MLPPQEDVQFQGIAQRYWVSVSDAAGNLGAVQAIGATGWGEPRTSLPALLSSLQPCA